MGCFNVSCGLTEASIGAGDDCILVPLVPRGRAKSEGDRGDWGILPVIIRGSYNDYGGIEDIEKNTWNQGNRKIF